jgi:hypothetical protein
MPVVSHIDRKSKEPVRKYYAKDADMYRLQLAALPDERDPETGRMKSGRNLVAQFKFHFFETNKPKIIELVEDSYAFHDGSIVDWDKLQEEAKEQRYEELKKLVSEDEDLLERLKGELVTTGSVGPDDAAESVPEQPATEEDVEKAEPPKRPTPKKKNASK